MLPSVVEHIQEYFPDNAANILWPLLHCDAARKGFQDKSFVNSLLSGGLNIENWRLGELSRLLLFQIERENPHIRNDARNHLLNRISGVQASDEPVQPEYTNANIFAMYGAWAEELLTLANKSGWPELARFLGVGTKAFTDHVFPALKDSLVFLAHLLNDPYELIQVLQDHYSQNAVLEFCVFCYCSYCFRDDDLVKHLDRFLKRLSFPARIEALRYLRRQGKGRQAGDLAGLLLERPQDFLQADAIPGNPLGNLNRLANQYYMLMLAEFAGDQQAAGELWEKLEIAGDEWKAGMFLQKTQASGAWKGSINFDRSLDNLQRTEADTDNLLRQMWSLADLPDFPVSAPTSQKSPQYLIRKYVEAHSNKQNDWAETIADEVIKAIRAEINQDNAGHTAYLFGADYETVIRRFIDADDLGHAEEAALAVLERYPAETGILNALSEIKEKQGGVQDALNYALMEGALKPVDADLLKRLSNLYHRSGEAGKAYHQLRKVCEAGFTLDEDERLRLAALAFESENYEAVDPITAPLLEQVTSKGNALLILGKTRVKQGLFDEAIHFFQKAVEDDPYVPERWVHLVHACRTDTDEHDVSSILNNALRYLPNSATILSELAQECYEKGNVSEAMEYLERAVNYPADTREGALTAGSLMTAMGDVRKAYDYYLDALTRFRFDTEITRLAALSAMDMGDYDAAGKILDALMSQIKPGAEDIALFVLAKLKGQSLIFADTSMIPEDDLLQLAKKIEDGLALCPDHPGLLILQGEIKARLGDYEAAREIFSVLIEREGAGHWKTLGGYGYASLMLDDLHTAIAALQESYSINPEQPKLEQYLAEAYLKAGLPSEAKVFADKLFFRNPNDLHTLLWYADLNGDMDNWAGVVSALINAYHINPGDPDIMLRLAEGFIRTSRNEDAGQLARLIRAMPDLNAENLLKLANLYAQMSDWQSSIDLLYRALENGESSAALVHFAAAILYQKLGLTEKALDAVQLAVQDQPHDRFLPVFQSDLYLKLGKAEQALLCLDTSEENSGETSALLRQPFFNHLQDQLHHPGWQDGILHGNGLVLRRALLLRNLNRAQEALEFVEQKAAEFRSEELLVMRLDLALRSLDFSGARALLRECRFIQDKELKQAAGKLNLRLNILLGNADQLKKLLSEGVVTRYNSTEWLCAQCLVYQADKNWEAAAQTYRQAKTVWANKAALPASDKNTGMSGLNMAAEIMEDQPFWLWITAAGVLQWEEALRGFEAAAQNSPDHPAMDLGYLKALTLAGEWSSLSDELELVKRKPSLERGSEGTRQLVKTLSGRIWERAHDPEVLRWINRAKILFADQAVPVKEISDQLKMPEDLEFLVGLLRQEKKYAPAAEIAAKLGRHFSALWQQALCYKLTDRDQAIQLLNTEIAQSAGFPLPLVALGQTLEANGDYPGAFQAYRKAAGMWKDEPKWQLHCAELAQKAGDDGAQVLYLKKALDLGYNRLETAMKIGGIHQGRAEYQKTIDILEPLYRDGQRNFELLMRLAAAYHELGDSRMAFEYAGLAQETDPGSEQPYALYAKISDSLGQYGAAMDYARKALERKPGDEDLMVLLSRYIARAGNPEEAFQLLEDMVVGGEAGGAVIAEYVRQKYQRCGSESILTFLENLKNKTGLQDDLHAYLAQAYFDNGQFSKAEQEAASAVRADPSSEEMNYLLAVLKQKNGQLDLASHYAAQAIQANPKNLRNYLELAEIYKSKKDNGNALEVYKKAIETNPENHLGYFHAGLLLRETHDYQEAELMLKQAAKLVPEDVNIRRQLSAVIALNLVHHAQEEKIIP